MVTASPANREPLTMVTIEEYPAGRWCFGYGTSASHEVRSAASPRWPSGVMTERSSRRFLGGTQGRGEQPDAVRSECDYRSRSPRP